MKNISIIALLAIALSACQKSADVTSKAQTQATTVTNSVNPVPTTPKTNDPQPQQPADLKPVASFTITNLNEVGNIVELRNLKIQNTSTNADTYTWDFGKNANYSDGVVDYPIEFSNKPEPANIYIAPCMQTITITLTAKNNAGVTSTTSQSFYIYCFRGTGGKHPLMHQLY